MKKILLILLFAFFFFLFIPNAYAKSNFDTTYNVVYDASNNENTKVTLNIELKNKTSDYYASSYSVQTGFVDIKNIKATDLGGDLKYSLQKNNSGSTLTFKFNTNVVGINKVQRFSVIFDTSEITKNYGNIWEVNIPGLQNQSEYEGFNVLVNVPKDFGTASIIKPQVKNLKQNGNSLQFNKSDLGEAGISIAYGESQIYNFNLKYHLYNQKLFPVTTEIAIPSSNNYQQIKIDEISPRPLNVSIDKDGNWLAKYKLSASSTQDVTVTGKAKVFHKPRTQTLSEQEKNLYLKPQKYWEVMDPKVKATANSLKTPEAIYNYVVKNLKYDPTRVKDNQVRAGALGVLNNKNSAVCLEFTDLFVTLARASGIPAREVEGFANTNNSANRPLSLFKDILHTWPEYYDFNKKAWIMVDPTWGNTTGGIDYFNVFDFDHLSFVINGEDSSYPVPAGGYKIPGDENIQDVIVVTSRVFDGESPELFASTDFSKNYLSGFPIEGNIVISNLSGVLSPSQTFNISSGSLLPNSQNLFFDEIPPFGKITVPVKFSPRPILTNETDIIKITIGQQTFEKEILVIPFYKNIYFFLFFGGILIGSITLTLSIFAYRRRHIHVS